MKRHQRSRHSGARRYHLALLGLIGSIVMSLALSVTLPSSARAQRLDPSPTFAIVNPAYNGIYDGPVDTNVTVHAQSGWTTGANIALSIEPDGTPCDPSTATPAQPSSSVTVDSGGFTATFRWPSVSAVDTAGPYRICANESGTGTQKGTSSNAFNVLTSSSGSPSSKPTVSVSATSVTTNGTLTVSGTNWVPAQQITLILQYANETLTQDPGITLSPKPSSDSNGNFTTSVTLPSNRINQQWILAVAGTQYQGTGPYPLVENSQPFNVSLATNTPTTVPSPTLPPPTIAPIKTVVAGSSTASNSNETVLVVLIGLIALVLLIAGVVIAVLAMRGHNDPGQTPGSGASRDNSGDGGLQVPGWNDDYASGSPWDETQAGPPPGWGGWQQPPGQPWSGRESRPYTGQMPPAGNAYDDTDEDDPYRTRMGEPLPPPNSRPQPGGPPPARPGNTSRPMSNNVPPRSGPRPPAGTQQNWQSPWEDGDTGQDTNANWPPNPPPPRR